MTALCARTLAHNGVEHVRTLASRLPLPGLDYESWTETYDRRHGPDSTR
jgi:hypothetical protein